MWLDRRDENLDKFVCQHQEIWNCQSKEDRNTMGFSQIQISRNKIISLLAYDKLRNSAFLRAHPRKSCVKCTRECVRIRNRVTDEKWGNRGWQSQNSNNFVVVGPSVHAHNSQHWLTWRGWGPKLTTGLRLNCVRGRPAELRRLRTSSA